MCKYFLKKGLFRGLFCLLVILLAVVGVSEAQVQDTVPKNKPDTLVKPKVTVQDTITVGKGSQLSNKKRKKKKRSNSPRKALLYSAAFPGFGQIYNRRYWKLIVIYGGGALLGLEMNRQHQRFLQFRDEFVKKSQDPNYEAVFNLTAENLKTIKDQAKRDRDFMIIMSVLVYGLQMVDANVDAHLMDFDLDENLSFRLQPTMESSPFSNFAALSLTFKF